MSENGKMEEPKKPEMSAIAVIDQLLIQLTDKILDTQTSVKEGQAQLLIVASTLELLRAIPGKMEAMEKQAAGLEKQTAALEKQSTSLQRETVGLGQKIEVVETAVKNSWGWTKGLNEILLSLQRDLKDHAELLKKVVGEKICHKHYLHWYGWIIMGLVVLCGGFAGFSFWALQEGAQYKASDMVLRGIKLVEDSVVLTTVHGEERKYEAAPEQYREDVIEEERRRAALTERLLEVNQKKQEIEELKWKKK